MVVYALQPDQSKSTETLLDNTRHYESSILEIVRIAVGCNWACNRRVSEELTIISVRDEIV